MYVTISRKKLHNDIKRYIYKKEEKKSFTIPLTPDKSEIKQKNKEQC